MTRAVENFRTPQELIEAGGQLALKRDIWDPTSIQEIVAKILDMFGLDIPNWEDALANWDALMDAFNGNYVGDDLALNAIQNVVGTLRRLSTGLINPSRLPLIPFSHIGESYPNLLENGGFDGADSLDGQDIWDWSETEGHTAPGAAHTTGDGSRKVLLSNGVDATPEQKFNVSGWLKWADVAGGANAFRVSAVAFAGNAIIEEKPVATISSPGAASLGWTQLTGTYEVPTGADSVRVQVEVGASVNSGDVWYDDMSVSKYGTLPQRFVNGLIDALGDLGAGIAAAVSQIGALFDRITGLVGATIADVQNFFSQLKTILSGGTVGSGLLPTLSNALRNSVTTLQTFTQDILDVIISGIRKVPVVGGSIADALAEITGLKTQADTTQTTAISARSTAVVANTIATTQAYNVANNKPLWMSLDPTAEVPFPLGDLSYATGGSMPSQTITASIYRLSKCRITNSGVFNTLSFLAYRTGTISTFVVEMWQYQEDGNTWLRKWTSDNLAAQLTTSLQKLQEIFSPGGLPMEAGGLWAVRFRMTGTGTVTLASKTFPTAFIPGFIPQTIGAAMSNTAIDNTATMYIDDSVMNSWNDGNTPYFEIGSNIGQVDQPRRWEVNFNNSSWNGFSLYHTGVTSSDLGISSGVVGYVNNQDGAQFGLYSFPTATDWTSAEVELLDSNGREAGVGCCMNNAGWGGVYLAIQSGGAGLFTIDNASYGTTNRAQNTAGGWGAGIYRLMYDPVANTFYVQKLASDNFTWVTRPLYWEDSGNVVKHGKGYRFGFIAIQRSLFISGSRLDNFALADWSY